MDGVATLWFRLLFGGIIIQLYYCIHGVLIMVMKGWDGLDLSLMDEEHNRGTAVVPGLGHEPAL